MSHGIFKLKKEKRKKNGGVFVIEVRLLLIQFTN